jgi:hypothetical protein
MGLNFLASNSSFEEPKVVIKKVSKKLPNPNPANYSIIRSEVVNGYLIIELKYHDCTNYEGKKIMVYECALGDLLKQKLIDPHFCDSKKYFSPIARFEPTERGWNNACILASNI